MPEMPKGLLRRGRIYYLRVWRNNREIWRSLHTENFIEARRLLDRYRHGTVLDRPRVTVEEAGRKWIATYVPTQQAAGTAKNTVARFERFIVPYLGHMLLGAVEPNDLLDFRLWVERRRTVRGKPPSALYVKHVMATVQTLMNWAVDSGLIDRTPYRRGMAPKIPDKLRAAYTREQVAVLAALPGSLGLSVRVALGTGARWGELRKMEARDIGPDGMLRFVQPKTGKAVSVPIDPELLGAIRGHVGRLVPFEWSASFNRAVRRESGIKDFTVKRCRDTYATLALEDGLNVNALRLVLGHSSVRVTEVYARPGESFIKAEAERLFERRSSTVAVEPTGNAVTPDTKTG